MSKKLFIVPNLEALPDDDLAALQNAFERLSKMALWISIARAFRKNGVINQALMYEEMVDRAYAELPGWAQW